MLEKIPSTLATLKAQRSQILTAGWFLQGCWLVQVKPGGTARTTSKYWQVRSRQPIFNGKRLKHLKPDEVEDYRAAIARGRQLQQLDRQIAKLQHQLAQSTVITESYSSQTELPPVTTFSQVAKLSAEVRSQPGVSPKHLPLTFTDLAEQERFVRELLVNSQTLRKSLRESAALNQVLRAKAIAIVTGYTHQ
jgi:hypothetical protein